MSSLIQQVAGAWPEASSAALIVALAGTGGGLFLWLAGSRFSQSLITLVAVGAGTIIGLKLPTYFDWPIAGWATATGAALILGVCGYAMHQMLAGVALAGILAIWAGGAVVTHYGLGNAIAAFFGPQGDMGFVNRAQKIWEALPSELHRVGPFVCALALAGGVGLALLWSRMATVLLYSLLGTTMLIVCGMTAMTLGRPGLLKMIPTSPSTKWSIFGAMVLLGVLVQWHLSAPRPQAVRAPLTKKAGEA